jgi:hypothetical protein
VLGHLIAEFHRPFGEQSLMWVTIALLMAISSALSAAQHNHALFRYGLAPPLLGGTLSILWSTFVRGRLDVWVHARGVAVQLAQKRVLALWTEIERVRYEESVGPAFYLVLDVGGRDSIVIASRSNAIRETLEEIVRRAMSIISVRCAADYHSGLDVDFGRLHLSKKRLAVKKGRGVSIVPLDRIHRFEVNEGRVRIEEKGDVPRTFCDIPVAEIANFGALETLLLRALAREGSGSR